MSDRPLATAQNEALYGGRYFGQEGYFDFEWLDSITNAISPGVRLLDIGGGNGVLACRMASVRGAVVTCLEMDEARARIARQNVFLGALDDRVTVLHMDMDRLEASFFDGYDMVFALDTLQHSSNLPALLGRIIGEVKPLRFIATIWCCGHDALARRWGFGRGYSFADVEHHIRDLRGTAMVTACPVFHGRFVRYRAFLQREVPRMTALIGSEASEARMALIDETLVAIKDGCFSQMVVAT